MSDKQITTMKSQMNLRKNIRAKFETKITKHVTVLKSNHPLELQVSTFYKHRPCNLAADVKNKNKLTSCTASGTSKHQTCIRNMEFEHHLNRYITAGSLHSSSSRHRYWRNRITSIWIIWWRSWSHIPKTNRKVENNIYCKFG